MVSRPAAAAPTAAPATPRPMAPELGWDGAGADGDAAPPVPVLAAAAPVPLAALLDTLRGAVSLFPTSPAPYARVVAPSSAHWSPPKTCAINVSSFHADVSRGHCRVRRATHSAHHAGTHSHSCAPAKCRTTGPPGPPSTPHTPGSRCTTQWDAARRTSSCRSTRRCLTISHSLADAQARRLAGSLV